MWKLLLPLLSVIMASDPDLQVGQFPINMAVSIILSVQKRLFSNCVYLLLSDNSGLTNLVTLNQLQKILTRHLFFTAAVKSILLEKYSIRTLNCQSNKPLFIILSPGKDIKQFLKQMSTNNLISKSKWLMFLDQSVNLDDFFSGLYIPIDCEFLVVERTKSHEAAFSEVYNVASHVYYNMNRVGVWNMQGITSWTTQSVFKRRNNLQNIIFKAAVEPDNMSIVIKEFTSEDLPLKVSGFFGEVWNILEKELNFRTEYVQPSDHAWGSLQSNNSWNGMVGMVVRGEAEVAITAFTMTKTRLIGVNFMSPFWNDGLTLYIRQPDSFQHTWDQYTSTFSKALWIAIAVDFTFLGLGLSATYYIGLWYAGAREDQRIRYTIIQSLFIALAILCQQSQVRSPSSISSRIVFVIAYMTAVVLLASYSATFISKLAIRYPKLPFTTFQEMLDDGTYRLGVLQSSAELDHFEKANDSMMQLLNVKMIAPEKQDLPKSHLEGLRRLCTREKYAFLGPNSILQSLLSNVSCRVVPLPHANIPATSAMVISKKSSYWRILKHTTESLQRAGVLKRLLKKFSPFKLKIVDSTFKMETVNIQMVTPLFIVLATGIFAGILLLLLEIFRHKIFIKILPQFNTRNPKFIHTIPSNLKLNLIKGEI